MPSITPRTTIYSANQRLESGKGIYRKKQKGFYRPIHIPQKKRAKEKNKKAKKETAEPAHPHNIFPPTKIYFAFSASRLSFSSAFFTLIETTSCGFTSPSAIFSAPATFFFSLET